MWVTKRRVSGLVLLLVGPPHGLDGLDPVPVCRVALGGGLRAQRLEAFGLDLRRERAHHQSVEVLRREERRLDRRWHPELIGSQGQTGESERLQAAQEFLRQPVLDDSGLGGVGGDQEGRVQRLEGIDVYGVERPRVPTSPGPPRRRPRLSMTRSSPP